MLLWVTLVGCCTMAAAQYVVFQPSIGYTYPPQVISPPPASPRGRGYVYGPPPPPPAPPSLHDLYHGPNQVQGPQVQGLYPPPQGDGYPLQAECLLTASSTSSVSGELHLTQAAPGAVVLVQGTVYGLSPGKHGFHVHRDPNTGDDCKAAGPHFNPRNQTHGAPSSATRHAGDLGNIVADGAGVASVEVAAEGLSLAPGAEGYAVGRAFVVHAQEDDLGLGGDAESLKTGNAGARLACCVVAQLF